MKPGGPKEQQVAALRLARAAGRRTNRISTAAVAAKPITAPVQASAPSSKESTMKSVKRMKKPATPAAKKRSVSEAAANLRAAKNAAKAKPKSEAEPKSNGGVRPGSKLEIVVGLLTRPEGCTTADVLSGTGWPAVSMPQMAKAAGLTLRKEKVGKTSRYYGAVAA